MPPSSLVPHLVPCLPRPSSPISSHASLVPRPSIRYTPRVLYEPPRHSTKTGVRIALGVAVAIVGYQLYALAFQIYKDSQIDIQYQAILVENAQLQEERDNLRQLINYLQTPGYKELEQKRIANLALPGEKALILERPGESTAVTSAEEPSDPTQEAWQRMSNVDRWWAYLFGDDELVSRPLDDMVLPGGDG